MYNSIQVKKKKIIDYETVTYMQKKYTFVESSEYKLIGHLKERVKS